MTPTMDGEMSRTAELMVDVAERHGVYFAFALVLDIGRTRPDQLQRQLEILEMTPGARKGSSKEIDS